MTAICIRRFAGPNVLSHQDLPRPMPTADQVLIRVHAAGVNPVGWKTRSGSVPGKGSVDPFPLVLGWDVSGIVAAVGREVTGLAAGDAVYGQVRRPSWQAGPGAWGGGGQRAVCRDGEGQLRGPRQITHNHVQIVGSFDLYSAMVAADRLGHERRTPAGKQSPRYTSWGFLVPWTLLRPLTCRPSRHGWQRDQDPWILAFRTAPYLGSRALSTQDVVWR